MDWKDFPYCIGVRDNPDRIGCEHRGNQPFSTDARRDAAIAEVAENVKAIVHKEDSEWYK